MGVASSSQTLKDAPVPNATAETLTMKVNTPPPYISNYLILKMCVCESVCVIHSNSPPYMMLFITNSFSFLFYLSSGLTWSWMLLGNRKLHRKKGILKLE
jgi:hypothetical protein